MSEKSSRRPLLLALVLVLLACAVGAWLWLRDSPNAEAPDESVRRWQHRVDPAWTRLAGGCHITRPIPKLIESAGFELVEVDSAYLPGPKIASYHSWGVARQR